MTMMFRLSGFGNPREAPNNSKLRHPRVAASCGDLPKGSTYQQLDTWASKGLPFSNCVHYFPITTRIHVNIYIYVYIYTCIYMHIIMSIKCVYIHLHRYIQHTYIYIYTHIYRSIGRWVEGEIDGDIGTLFGAI